MIFYILLQNFNQLIKIRLQLSEIFNILSIIASDLMMQGLVRTQSSYQNITCLQDMFQKASQNYAYRLLQLQMTIDQTGLSIGRTKKEDISQLIQLYMIGVEVLESTGDSRFGYFRTKLHDLMLKKEVIRELKFTTPDDILKKEKQVRENKRKEHESKLAKSEEQETKQVNSIIHTATTTVEHYKQSVQNTLKKQQNQIKQRLSSRNKRPETANGSIPKSSLNKPTFGTLNGSINNPTSEYYNSPQIPKVKRQPFGLEMKVISAEGSPIQKQTPSSPSRFHKPPLGPKKSQGI